MLIQQIIDERPLPQNSNTKLLSTSPIDISLKSDERMEIRSISHIVSSF